jgi:SAM-dependent methyltransferase
VASLNLETDEFPYSDEYFDIIVINQVLEHVKEFFWIVSEINRVLKNGGLLIIGVPNLASWHNRLLLLLGQQPTSIRILGPHVRGYTKNDLVMTMNTYGGFELYDYGGSNFYPFPPFISKIFSKFFPLGSVSLFCAFKKIKQSTFKEFLSERLETNFKMPKS